MAISKELVMTIAFEVGVIAVSTIASFLIPGLGGLILSGALQFFGDLGIEFAGGQIPESPVWFITEFLAVFGPFFQEFKAAKLESTLLRDVEKGVITVEKTLQKIDDALFEGIEHLKNKASKAFNRSSGLTEDLEKEVKQIEQQEIAREKFGTDKVKVKKKVVSFTPNTKNPDSWIAGIGFVERSRFGPRDIRGDLIITYYTNNAARIGYALKPIEKIVLGRTSAGETVSGGKNNKSRYRKLKREIRPDGVEVRKVVFKDAKYFSDYLGFAKAGSWGGYYMRRWMVGLPGRKEAVNGLILFGSIWRVYSKLKSLAGDGKEIVFNSKEYFKGKGKEYFGSTQFGSRYNKVNDVFSKGNNLRTNPFRQTSDFVRPVLEKRRDNMRQNNIHKNGKK